MELFGKGVFVVMQHFDRYGRTRLHRAAYFGLDQACSFFVSHESLAPLEAKDINGRTALYYAVWQKRDVCWRILLEAGASPNCTDINGVSILHLAAWTQNSSCVRALLKRGADPRSQCVGQRYTALHLAARSGDAKTVALLAKTGVALDWKDQSGFTPLDYAIHIGSRKCAAELIRAGASLCVVYCHVNIGEWLGYQ